MKHLLIPCLLTVHCLAQERYVEPVDEGKKDPSFLAFRNKLIKTVKKRDLPGLMSVTDSGFRGSLGPEENVGFFKKKLESPSPDQDLWKELLLVLTHGGSFQPHDPSSFCAPYLFGSFPEDVDPCKFQAIFGNNVNLRSGPGLKAPVTARLSYNIVRVDYEHSVPVSQESDRYAWLMIETLGGKKGYVNAGFVRSPVGYRAGFNKVSGKWKLRLFLAGD